MYRMKREIAGDLCRTMELVESGGSGFLSARDEKVEAMDLLEECWFFGNSLEKRKMMSRCYSDPCSPSGFFQEMLVRNSNAGDHSPPATEKLPPPSVGTKEGAGGEGDIRPETAEPSQKSSRRGLLRTPSMPASVRTEGLAQYKERDSKSSKLIRTTSLGPPDTLPRLHNSKGLTQSFSTPRHRLPRKQEQGTMSMDVAKDMRRRYLNQTKTMRKSLSDLESEEVQGFKDLGFTFEKEDLSPSVVNILPGLQDKNRDRGGQIEEEDNVRRPYLSEAWLEQCYAPPIPNWVGKGSTQDMKTHIKFWARAVASNVHLEC